MPNLTDALRQVASVGLIVCALCTIGGGARAQAPPDLILLNGRIFTGDPTTPWAEALSVRGERILEVGSSASVSGTASPKTRVIDLGGRTAIPGINDAHDHLGELAYGIAVQLSRPPMADPSIEDVAQAFASAANGEGTGWLHAAVGPTALAEAIRMRAALDRATAGRPALVHAWWGHGVVLNTAGMKELGLVDATTDDPGGRLERDADGHLTGKLDEYAGWRILRTLQSQAGQGALQAYLRSYAERRLRQGITSVQIMAGDHQPELLAAALAAEDLPLRVRLIRFPMPHGASSGLQEWSGVSGQIAPRVRVSGVKWVLDGTPVDQLAFQTRPYANRPDWFGRPNFDVVFLRHQLTAALEGGEPLLLHAVGDAMVDRILKEMEALAPPERWTPLRVRVEHANGLVGDRLERARRMGIVIGQPRPTAPYRVWFEAAQPVAYGSDIAFQPFASLAAMTDPASQQSISREQAVRILTAGPAYAEFAEQDKGVLTPGKLADIAVLSQDIFAVGQGELAKTKAVLMIIGGATAYDGLKSR